MTSMPKVSVSVPVYNTSEFLRQCLDSLAAQTMRDIEFILVDDGSTDGSGDICDEYAARDSRFKVVHQPNGGSASARQTALDQALGQYIIVCDSDDWTDPALYRSLYRKAVETDADITLCGHVREYGNRSVDIPPQPGLDAHRLALEFEGGSWVMLVKRSFLDACRFSYDTRINCGEDRLALFKFLEHKPRLAQIDDCLYHYRRMLGGASCTSTLSEASIDQMLMLHRWLQDHCTLPERTLLVQTQALNTAFACLRSDLSPKEVKNIFAQTVPWRKLAAMPKSLKWAVVASAKIVPTSLMRRFVKAMHPFIYR